MLKHKPPRTSPSKKLTVLKKLTVSKKLAVSKKRTGKLSAINTPYVAVAIPNSILKPSGTNQTANSTNSHLSSPGGLQPSTGMFFFSTTTLFTINPDNTCILVEVVDLFVF
jgi:hypothetical protein